MKLKSKFMLTLALTGLMAVGGVTAMAQETAQTTYKTVNARHEGPNKIVKENLKLTQEWDKTFKKSDKVDHQKVTFVNRYGITLAADMYTPKDAKGKLPALAVAGPFGAVKEQASGLYAQTMAEKGFVTLAFDPSFTGESGARRVILLRRTSTRRIFQPLSTSFRRRIMSIPTASALSAFAASVVLPSMRPLTIHVSKRRLLRPCTI